MSDQENLSIALGRINGIHALLLAVLRELPKSTAEACERNARTLLPKVEADLLACPIPDLMMNEMLRVIAEGIEVLSSAAKSNR